MAHFTAGSQQPSFASYANQQPVNSYQQQQQQQQQRY